MGLDPEAAAILEAMAEAQPQVELLEPSEARRLIKEAAAAMPRPELVTRTEDRTVPTSDGELPVRLYRPAADGVLPAIVYFHGGGWTICDVDMFDATCDALAAGVGALVVSVDYRLAPEHRFPAPAEDCYAATSWVADHADDLGIDASRVAVAGDSAGGNLAAAVALMARDRGRPALAFQLLVYPVTVCEGDPGAYDEELATPILTSAAMAWYCRQYAPGEDGREAYASPLLAPDLAGLPPTHVVTAEVDVLREQGEAYAERLREAGVPVTHTTYPGAFHGFFGLAGLLTQATEAQAEACARVRAALGG